MEKSKGAPATPSEIRNLVEWLLCTWDHAHRLELVANDIRIDKLGVDVELMSVHWYAQIPNDIVSIYACCSYVKQCEALFAYCQTSRAEVVCNGHVLRDKIRTV